MENPKPVFIYALKCPITGNVRYIGKANDIQKRLKSHLRDARLRNTPVYCWIRKLSKSGLLPLIETVYTTDENNWAEAEKAQIIKFRNDGFELLNVAEGGNEPYCSPEQRKKNGSNIAFNRKSDPKKKRIWALKRQIGEALKHGWVTDTTKAKLRLAAQKAPHLFGEYANL